MKKRDGAFQKIEHSAFLQRKSFMISFFNNVPSKYIISYWFFTFSKSFLVLHKDILFRFFSPILKKLI
jgi:hypothetical protein